MLASCRGHENVHREHTDTYVQFAQTLPEELETPAVDGLITKNALTKDEFEQVQEIRYTILHDPLQSDSDGERTRGFWIDTHDDRFLMLIGFVIAANAVVCGLETDYGAKYFANLEMFFCMVYLLEMILKLYQDGCRSYCCNASNLFDATLVLIGCIDLLVVPLLKLEHSNLSTLKTARLLRSLRVLRLARLLRMTSGLHLIIDAYVQATTHIAYVVVMIVSCLYMIAVFMTQLIGHHADLWPEEDREKIHRYFGSIGATMQSMFIVMTMENWTVDASLLEDFIPTWVLFPGFVCWIVIAFSLIGLFPAELCCAYKRAKEEEERMYELKMKGDQDQEAALEQQVEEIFRTCKVLDENDDGMLSRKEVFRASRDDTVLVNLQAVDIFMEKGELLEIMDRLILQAEQETPRLSLDRDSVAFPIKDVVKAIVEVQGHAQGSKVNWLAQEVQSTRLWINRIRQEFGQDLGELEQLLDDIQEDYQYFWTHNMHRIDQEIGHLESRAEKFEQRMRSSYDSLNAKLESLLQSMERSIK